ncbi:hypothetical protein HDU88_003366 [Geranomyces variabilis]|nr:hypothetical protein HDU88_003366 [Geranomyces variabilis]
MSGFCRSSLALPILTLMLLTLIIHAALAPAPVSEVEIVAAPSALQKHEVRRLTIELRQLRELLESNLEEIAPSRRALLAAQMEREEKEKEIIENEIKDKKISEKDKAALPVLPPPARGIKSTPAASAAAAAAPTTKTVLVGLFTVPEKIQRRALIRATYLQLKPPNVDFFFVFGTPSTPEHRRLLEWEQRAHGDVMVVPCEENMDGGKTFYFFNHVAKTYAAAATHNENTEPRYQFVMKADDDVWLHLPNLAARLDALPKDGTYFGREVHGAFMAGMGYALSWDMVAWISADPFPAENKVGQEDATLAWWLAKGNQVSNWVSEDSEFYDDPSYMEGWAHEYTPGTILIHRLKNETVFLRASAHFLDTALDDAPDAVLAKQG